MAVYDWLVVGAGVTGAALSYELQRSGWRVALIDRSPDPLNATHLSYGGIPFWSGRDALTQKLCQEAIGRYPGLGDELGYDIHFRSIKLLLTLAPEEDKELVRQNYPDHVQWLDPQGAQELEPLLNREAIGGAFVLDHAQVDPRRLVRGYLQAFTRLGGALIYEEVVALLERGVKTLHRSIGANGVIVCAGGMGRRLLNRSGVNLPLFFTHAELIETLPSGITLRTFIMPAQLKRLDFEAKGALQVWREDQPEILPPSFDVGGTAFPDGRMCLGQISRLHPNPDFVPTPTSEAEIRSGIRQILPALADLPGTWHHCLVAFSKNSLPLIGQIQDYWWIFSGFTSPMVYLPPLAYRFAQYLRSRNDRIIEALQISPTP